MTSFELSFATLLTLGLCGLGCYMLLPYGKRSQNRVVHTLGLLLVSGSLIVLAQQIGMQLLNTTNSFTFYVLAGVSLASAVMMLSAANPVVAALWFALVLLSNSGLYLLQGAEFLSAATIIIYAGAIIVTFLFVIMLAQPKGTAVYDHYSREPLLSCLTGVLLSWTLVGTLHYTARYETTPIASRQAGTSFAAIPPQELVAQGTRAYPESHIDFDKPHVKELGETLFKEHYVSVELIAVLLLAAVVGALLIVQRGHEPLPKAG